MPHCINEPLRAFATRITAAYGPKDPRRGYHLIIYDIRPINHSINEKHEELIFG
jgi:hypothetical protein